MQDDVIAFLSSSDGHPGGGPVETVQTHGALIFLAGDIALKIKRAVRYDYMDLSTLDKREAMLRRELELNQPVAPEIYQDVIPVTTQPDGTLALGGDGTPVEWALRMRRFPAENELAVIADTKGIDDALADDLGHSLHAYHAQMPLRSDDGTTLIRDILDELDRVFADMEPQLGADRIARFGQASRAALSQISPLLSNRAESGHVRRCHGDLHLRNLVIIDGKPVPFDALEFDEVLGTCDVLYDLAFLLMDLDHRGLDRAANMVLNAYLLAAKGDEDAGLAALPLFLSVRAAIHAMVAVQTAAATNQPADPDAHRLLDDAEAYLRPAAPSTGLVGGLSGTGKTTVSRGLAPLVGAAPGAVHLRTDLERKSLFGVSPNEPLEPPAYTPDARKAVYDRLFARAAQILASGHSVLVDATFLDADVRTKAEGVAKASGVDLRPLWLDAPLPILVDRVRARVGDASDADADVVRQQFASHTAPSDWHIVSAAGTPDETLAITAKVLSSDS